MTTSNATSVYRSLVDLSSAYSKRSDLADALVRAVSQLSVLSSESTYRARRLIRKHRVPG